MSRVRISETGHGLVFTPVEYELRHATTTAQDQAS